MRIERLRLADVRCHAAAELAPAGGVTAIVGPNGSGKTSLLEALHLGLRGTGLRPAGDARMVRDGAARLGVRVEGEAGGAASITRIDLAPGGRRIELDGVEVDARTLRERWAAVVFIPDLLDLVKRGPVVRRLALDRAIELAWPRFEEHERAYRHAVEQRNAVLRRVRRGGTPAELDPWDEQVAEHGAVVVEARDRLVTRLAPLFADRAAALGGDRPASLAYRASIAGDPAALRSALEAGRARDIERQTTGCGPHLDDLEVALDGRDARRSASQGEQRTLVLAFLLAQAALVGEARDERPILLLDDVLSELDRDRRARLVELARTHGQTLLTATGADGVDALADAVHALGTA
ncbi:MAG: DNA replication/repair protein RecF [Gaiellales bacterium]